MRRQTRLDREARRSKSSTKVSTNHSIFKRFLIFILWVGIICCFSGLFLLYGPYSGFRDWYISTAMGTMRHQYLAEMFYDKETVDDCLSRNKIIEVSGTTDASKVEFTVDDNKVPFANEYEEAVLKRSDKNNDYKIIPIKEDKFTGYLTVIYDPSRVKLVTTSKLGVSGEYLSEISKKHDSLVAINAGGFEDEGGEGTGSTGIGTIISKGKVVSELPYNQNIGGLIGFNSENVLVLDSKLNKEGIRDGVTFYPFFILNGEVSKTLGNGGAGRAPRTAIGQRADGKVLFLVIDGSRTLGRGATYQDEIKILQRYGAINAANLDGGTSTCMTVGDRLVNNPTSKDGDGRSRLIVSAFILTKDDSDDGDHTVVDNKLN